MNVEAIEKELKSIKALAVIALALVLIYLSEILSRSDGNIWNERMDSSLTVIIIGLVLGSISSPALWPNRLQWPNLQKSMWYAGLGAVWAGTALYLVARLMS